MKKINTLVLTGFYIVTGILFNGCIKDTCRETHHYTFYEPVYKTTAEVRANIKSNAARSIHYPGKIFIKGNYIFLNEVDKGIHIIDNTNPAHPVNMAFIDIPGNVDLAVKGNTLYADLYTDLVTIDITNPAAVVTKKIIEGVFPFRSYSNGFMMDSSRLIVDWVERDTTVVSDCRQANILWSRSDVLFVSTAEAQKSTTGAATPFGVGGSMARFTIMDNRLYTVTNSDLNVFNITSVQDPVFSNKVPIGFNIETIYPFKNNLFIGSSMGMFRYTVINPDKPMPAGQFTHVQSCDPVIADDNYAYVTLRSGTRCQGFTNELEILQLTNFPNPSLVKTYPFKNPHGLSKDGNLLFICDGYDGLKIFNASDVHSLSQVRHFTGIEAYDVIAWNNIALLSAKDGLYQYDYSNPGNIHLLSKIQINN